MKKAILTFCLICIASTSFSLETIYPQNYLLEFHGSRLLAPVDKTTVLTDGAPTVTITVPSTYMSDIVVDLTIDKGSTIVITPLLDVDDLGVLGTPSTPLVVSDLGGTVRSIYSKISAPNVLVTITKTEAGSTASFFLSVRGLQN